MSRQAVGIRSLGIMLLAMLPTVALVLWYVAPWEQASTASAPAAASGYPTIAPLGLEAVTANVGPAALPEGHPEVGRRPVSTADDIEVRVAYAGDVTTLPASARVYVFVREPGSRMPLAVERREPGELPVSVSFGGAGLSQTGLEVVGRLTMDGDVRLKPGDLEIARPLRPDAERPVQLVLGNR